MSQAVVVEARNSHIQYASSSQDIYRLNRYALDERFVIRDGKMHKCAIICPGGGYSMVCSFIEGTPIAKDLNRYGISAIIVYYRVRKKAKFPNPQDDLARAVKEIHERKDELHLDMDGYSIWGSSAGGHLVGSFGTRLMGYKKYQLPKPGLLVCSYPVVSLESSVTHQGTRDNLIGKNACHEEELLKSVHTNIDASFPPTFVWCGNADQTVPMTNTELLRDALEKNRIPYRCHIYEGVDHGVGPGRGTEAEGWIDDAVSFWKQQLV